MIYYFGFFLVLGILQIVKIFRIPNKTKNIVIMALAGLITILFQGLRAPTVGTDLASYLPAYEEFKSFSILDALKGKTLYGFEWGYAVYNVILGKLGCSEQLFLIITSAVINILVLYTIYKCEKDMPLMVYFLYLTTGLFAFSFSGLRQSIAISITFLSFLCVKNKHFIRFLISVFIAFLFHKTAIIFIFAYPAYNLYINKKIYIMSFLVLTLFILCFNKQIVELAYLLMKGSNPEIRNTNAYGFFIGLLAVWLFVIFTYKRINLKEKDELFRLSKLLAIAILIQALAPVHDYIARLGYYYFIYLIFIVVPYLKYFRDRPLRIAMIIIIICVMLLYFYYSNSGNVLNLFPYKFFWQ